MLTTPVSSPHALQSLSAARLPAADTNRDGTVSNREFEQFIDRLLAPRPEGNPAAKSEGSSTSTVAETAPLAARPMVPEHLLRGFNPNKLGNLDHRTVKYLFGRVARHYDVGAVRGIEDAEALLQQMRPELEAAGLQILAVKGDKLTVVDDAGKTIDVDVINGARSGSAAYQWHVIGAGTASASAGVNQLNGFNGAKLADPSHTTVKYLFGRVAQAHDLSSVQNKDDAQQVLSNMRDELEAAGLKILDIIGDRLRLLDDTGSEIVVDVIQGASTGAATYHWSVD